MSHYVTLMIGLLLPLLGECATVELGVTQVVDAPGTYVTTSQHTFSIGVSSQGGFKTLRLPEYEVADVTGVAWISSDVVAYSVSPLYGEPGLYLYNYSTKTRTTLVAATNRNLAYPKGADYFELKSLDGNATVAYYYYAPDVDEVEFEAFRNPKTIRKVDLVTQGPPTQTACGINSFTESPSEHIIVELDRPFIVRSVEGTIASQGGDWPEDTRVLVELRSAGGAGRLIQARADSRGLFKMPDVEPGEYCFKATVDGWQSVIGVIVVSDTADPASRVSFEMLLGV